VHLLTKAEAREFVAQRAELFDTSPNPFARSAWLLHFIDEIVREDWTVIAPESHPQWGALLLYSTPNDPVRRALTNYYASLYSTVGNVEALDPLVRQLSLQPRCSEMIFAPLDAQAPDTMALEQALKRYRWFTRRYFCHANWHLPCSGLTFDEYLAGRNSQLRNTITRKEKKFPGDIRIVSMPNEIDKAMDAFDAVYAKSWKQPEPYPNFVRGWARICAENGWLRLGIASIDDVPIAAQFWFVMDEVAYIFKLAYDENYSKWSAGTLLTARLMRHALDVDRVSRVDYLTGDDEYKAAWMTHRRVRFGIVACNLRTSRGLARAATEFAGGLKHRVLRERSYTGGAEG
jgi:hypothetical protein